MRNGYGNGHGNSHGNGKRWLLIGLLVLGGFWILNNSYDDGYRDALIDSGQVSDARNFRGGGPDFPWGLVILGGIAYIAYRKGAFDRLGGMVGPFGNGGGNGQQGIQRYEAGNGPVQTPAAAAPYRSSGPMFRGPRGLFEEWHRQSHEVAQSQHPTPPARPAPPTPPVPPAPPAPPAGPGYAQTTDGAAQPGMPQTPPPPPPSSEYWAAMARAAESGAAPGAPGMTAAPPETRPSETPDAPRGGSGPATEQW